jgi:DNA-binding transcriptional MocR family regulator
MTVKRFSDSGLLDSGGGNSHFAGLVAATYARSGDYVRQVRRLAAAYAARCEALLRPFRAAGLEDVAWTEPRGGFFTWLTFGSHISGPGVRRRAEQLGASFALGSDFYLDGVGGHNAARLAFTRFDEAALERAGLAIVRALGEALSGPQQG